MVANLLQRIVDPCYKMMALPGWKKWEQQPFTPQSTGAPLLELPGGESIEPHIYFGVCVKSLQKLTGIALQNSRHMVSLMWVECALPGPGCKSLACLWQDIKSERTLSSHHFRVTPCWKADLWSWGGVCYWAVCNGQEFTDVCEAETHITA